MSNIIKPSEMEQEKWMKDVGALESHLAKVQEILQYCKNGYSAEECVEVNSDLSDQLVGKVVAELIDCVVPICKQLQKASARVAAAPKDEVKVYKKQPETEKVCEKKMPPSFEEVVVVQKEQGKSFAEVIERNESEGTSLKEAVSNILEFVKNELNQSQEDLHLPPTVSKIADATEYKKKEKKDLLEVAKVNRDESSSLGAVTTEDANIPAVFEEEKKQQLNSVPDDSFLQRFIQCREDRQSKVASTIALENVKVLSDQNQRQVEVKQKGESLAVVVEGSDKVCQSSSVGAAKATGQEGPSLVAANSEVVLIPAPYNSAKVKNEDVQKANVRVYFPSKHATAAPKMSNPSVSKEIEKKNSIPLQSSIIPNKKKQDQVEEMIMVPPDRMGYVAGKSFANVNRLQDRYGVRVSLPTRGGSEVFIRGSAENVAGAKNDILESLPVTLTYPTEKYFIGFIIGNKGAVIKGLRKGYGVSIEIDEEQEMVILDGNKERCHDALLAIKAIIAKREKFDARYRK